MKASLAGFWAVAIGLGALACSPAALPADPSPMSTSTSDPAPVAPPWAATGPSFAADLAFLEAHGDVILLEAPHGARVAVSPTYQGRVMTSAVSPDGSSLGYLNRKFIERGTTGTAFDNYGGEDRFWLGPEGGPYALYFAPGDAQDFDHWQTPASLQEGAWEAREVTAREVTFMRPMTLTNYAGTELTMEVRRRVRLLGAGEVGAMLKREVSLEDLSWVAFETENTITNTGKEAWTAETGLPSIWILAMYNPSPDTWVVVPFDTEAEGAIVKDDYFGKVPGERLVVDEGGWLFFAADGEHRSKIGLPPGRAGAFAGSYAPSSRQLTVVSYNAPQSVAEGYVNSMWGEQHDPYAGDVINAYNDGPVAPGQPALGGFYEIETSSPAAALAPGASLTHRHRTLHLVGDPAALAPISEAALGRSPAQLDRGAIE